jgi:hypothetical protein
LNAIREWVTDADIRVVNPHTEVRLREIPFEASSDRLIFRSVTDEGIHHRLSSIVAGSNLIELGADWTSSRVAILRVREIPAALSRSIDDQ